MNGKNKKVVFSINPYKCFSVTSPTNKEMILLFNSPSQLMCFTFLFVKRSHFLNETKYYYSDVGSRTSEGLI